MRSTSLIIARAREQCRVAKSFEQNRRCSPGKNHPRLNPPEKPLFRIPRNRMDLNSKQMLKRGYDSPRDFFSIDENAPWIITFRIREEKFFATSLRGESEV